MTQHGVTQRERTPTRFSLTTTSLTLSLILTHTRILFLTHTFLTLTLTLRHTNIAQDTMGYLRTSLAKTSLCFQSAGDKTRQQLTVLKQQQTLPRPSLRISAVSLLSPVKSYGQSQKHPTCAAKKPLVCTL